MRASAWEGIGKELKIKGKFYVSSRDVRIVWPRLKISEREWATCCLLAHARYNANDSISGNGKRFRTKMLIDSVLVPILFR
jgi:hypothetical protein